MLTGVPLHWGGGKFCPLAHYANNSKTVKAIDSKLSVALFPTYEHLLAKEEVPCTLTFRFQRKRYFVSKNLWKNGPAVQWGWSIFPVYIDVGVFWCSFVRWLLEKYLKNSQKLSRVVKSPSKNQLKGLKFTFQYFQDLPIIRPICMWELVFLGVLRWADYKNNITKRVEKYLGEPGLENVEK